MSRLGDWFSDPHNLRRFAFVNIVIWVAQHPIVILMQLFAPGWLIVYVAHLSVAALWLSSLAWWQSTRVEERQADGE